VNLDIQAATVGELREALMAQYPALQELRSLFIAVNQSYADDSQPLRPEDEIALIPPVSGG
jgi:molybdopterin synthase sulfur carrier subunit